MQHGLLAAIAVSVGVLLAVVLFVPFVVASYRVNGRVSGARLVVWFAALVYFCAIWTYTLLPLPDPRTITCSGTNLNPLAFLDDISTAISSPGTTLTHPAVLQLVLNVALFVPLGFFIRALAGRGIVTSLLVGLAISGFIETTQLTGVWGLYPCAYRVFDVDDLLTNTTGAALGSVASLLAPARLRETQPAGDAGAAGPVTKSRRLLAMMCDALGYLIAVFVAAVAMRAWLLYVTQDRDLALSSFPSDAAALAVAAIWLLAAVLSGRSLGDFAVQVRYDHPRLPPPIARTLRSLGGVTGYTLLTLLPDPWSLTANLFAVVSIVLVFTTTRGRGLPGILSGQELNDARSATVGRHSD